MTDLPPSKPRRGFLTRMRENVAGVAATEFALTLPFFISLGLVGFDTARYVVTHMRISQIAMHVADNGSRVGEHNVLVARKLYENHINDLLVGADRYAEGLDLEANGRIILSSLERNDDDGQWIHWQRCYGDKDHESSYGDEGDGEDGTSFPGMGPSGAEITASEGSAVIFVEVAYDYDPVTPFSIFEDAEIVYTGAFNVRDSRDLTGVYQTNPTSTVASCD